MVNLTGRGPLMGSVDRFFMETAFTARIVVDTIRDNFVGYVPTDPQRHQALQAEFDVIAAENRPQLGQLLKIEAALVDLMPDDMVCARLWSVQDRFRRVVPATTLTAYAASSPDPGSAQWSEPRFVKNQYKSLLDVIHINYLMNIGREKSIKRAKFIVVIAMTALTIAFLIVAKFSSDLVAYLVFLFIIGLMGATMSICRRLQTVVSHDAMTEDPIFELTGLRSGWVGLMLSLFMGGVFALVMYAIVMAGSLDSLLTVPEVADSIIANEAVPDAPVIVADRSQQLVKTCSARKGDTICDMAKALHLADISSLFRLILFAFAAGFAERLVPDMLGRLSKQSS
ncbi:hypothetical protein FYJ91_07485 [Sphingomonas montanisoli]|uniref:Uncharacterized protein n=2 Tax=Sphingomonas montanisoli TaxID=2606412 RepID=A0A5D9C6F4_9SPHN|nr:hypothetical protein FYJ91_07485 [Sphingomonas montanisoli]